MIFGLDMVVLALHPETLEETCFKYIDRYIWKDNRPLGEPYVALGTKSPIYLLSNLKATAKEHDYKMKKYSYSMRGF